MFKYLIGILVAKTLSILQVYQIDCAVNHFQKPIEYSLSNFGYIPYGQTLLGQIYMPRDKFLCKLDEQNVITSSNSSIKNVVLVQRGECKFTQKALNAQNLGADIIIIFNNNEDSSVIMANDGRGHLVQIPSLFISHIDGYSLHRTNKDCPGSPMINLTFETKKSDISKVTLWIDPYKKDSFIFIHNLYKHDFYSIIEGYIKFEVKFPLQSSFQSWNCRKQDCLGTLTEKYCRNLELSSFSEFSQVTGREIIYQQLRQYFLWQKMNNGIDNKKWWTYMIKFDDEKCLEMNNIEECSFYVMRDAGVSEQEIQSIKTLIKQTMLNISNSQVNIFKTIRDTSYDKRIFYPSVTVNNQNFYGLCKAPEVLVMICKSLQNPPHECIAFAQDNHRINNISSFWRTVFYILLAISISFIMVFFIYTHIIRAQMRNENNRMIQNQMVSLVKISKSFNNEDN